MSTKHYITMAALFLVAVYIGSKYPQLNLIGKVAGAGMAVAA